MSRCRTRADMPINSRASTNNPRTRRHVVMLWRSWLFKSVDRFAPRASFRVIIALKFGQFSLVEASGACKMKGLTVSFGLAQAAHDITGWRFPAFISLRLLGKIISSYEAQLEHGQLRLQLRIRHLRILNLLGEFGEDGGNFATARFLRFLENSTNGRNPIRYSGGGLASLAHEVQCAVNLIGTEIHRLFILRQAFASNLNELSERIKGPQETEGRSA